MGRVIKRDAVAIILVALTCGIFSVLPPFKFIHGWSIDALTALRWEVFGVRRDPARRGDLRNSAVPGIADPDLDHGNWPGSECGHRWRSQGCGFRYRISQVDRTIRASFWRRFARSANARFRPGLPSISCEGIRRWEGGAGRSSGR